METRKRLGDAELEIMQVIWRSTEPVNAQYILERLKGRAWALSTLQTTLARLVDKGFVDCNRTYRYNLYSPLIAEDDFKAWESETFLAKMYGNSLQNFVTTLYNKKVIDGSDIKELRQFLNSFQKKEE